MRMTVADASEPSFARTNLLTITADDAPDLYCAYTFGSNHDLDRRMFLRRSALSNHR